MECICKYRIASNSGPGVYFFQWFFTPATEWDRYLLVEVLFIICDSNSEFWWQLMMREALYCTFNFVTWLGEPLRLVRLWPDLNLDFYPFTCIMQILVIVWLIQIKWLISEEPDQQVGASPSFVTECITLVIKRDQAFIQDWSQFEVIW